MLLFYQSAIRSAVYIAFDKCFYNRNAVVEISLYITFLIHEKSLHSMVMHNEAYNE